MARWNPASAVFLAILGLLAAALAAKAAPPANDLNRILNAENQSRGVSLKPVPLVDDLAYLRRVSIDLIGRIPTQGEVGRYLALPASKRRGQVVEKLLADERFVDRWTIFFADMLRLRSNADGGASTIAYVHRAIEEKMPYDVLVRRLISASGKVGATPEIGFILGDNADPMALAGATAQTFLGIRVSCAQCHDHPFDVWTREDFYGLAAYFGNTRRTQSQFTNAVYTTEVAQSTVLWPPEGEADAADRKPMKPAFPFKLLPGDGPAKVVARLNQLRLAQAERDNRNTKKTADSSIDDLLADADAKVEQRVRSTSKSEGPDVAAEAKRDVRKLNVRSALSRQSELRTQLAEVVVSPRNWYFSRSFVNRVWAELIGRGFVEPIDNFTAQNMPSHRKTIDYLGDEFVASGYDLRTLVRMIVTSEAYQRGHALGVDEPAQQELEAAFLATPMRRMISESLFDSIVVAGHLFDVKHAAGRNIKTVWRQTRVAKRPAETDEGGIAQQLANVDPKKMERPAGLEIKGPAYDLESAIELDFDALLKPKEDAAVVEKMTVMSKEEIEAMRMAGEMRNRRPNVDYFDRFVKAQFDDNPRFGSSLRMVSPANPEHFLRVFGQTGRAELGERRHDDPSMRQALMMLNGRLTHEASRVGELEAVYPLLVGKKADLDRALKLVYLEILTRQPTAEEIAEAGRIVKDADTSLDGMADLRWILLNCNEFRFLP